MRVELKEVENKGFKPFKIEITIETIEELKDLQNRMYISPHEVNQLTGKAYCTTDIDSQIHEVLCNIARERKIYL